MPQFLPTPALSNHPLAAPDLQRQPRWGAPQADPAEGVSIASVVGLLRRHWLLASGIVLITLIGAYLATRMTVPQYRASTTVYFADHQGSVPALDLLNEIENGNNQVATEMEVMRSRALAENVVDSLGLQVTVTQPKGAGNSAYLRLVRVDPFAPQSTLEFTKRRNGDFEVRDGDSGATIATASVGKTLELGTLTAVVLPTAGPKFELTLRPRQAAVDALVANMKVSRPNPTASVVQVSYTGPDPLRTKNVPDVLASTYLAWRANLRKAGDRSTVEFLRAQIDTIATQLYAAEEALRHFRETNQVVDLPQQAQSGVQRLASLEAQRADIDIQRAALKSLMAGVKSAPIDPRLGSPYRRLLAFPGLLTTSSPALPLLQTLTGLEQRRTELTARRTVNDPDVQSLTQAITDIEGQIAGVVDTYMKGLDEQAASLATSVAAFHGQVDQVPRREVEYARLERTQLGLTQIYTMLQTRLREAQIAEAVDDGAVRIVDPATLPTVPVAPRPALNMVLGALFGILLALAAVFLRESLDRSVHTKQEVETIAGAAVLALIPHIGQAARLKYVQRLRQLRRSPTNRASRNGASNSEAPFRLLLQDPQSVAAEAFRKLRTNITFARPDSPPRTLIFTSSAPGDGKSTSVMNLAIALVQQGKRVLVIDGDMRRGGLHKMVSGMQAPGLSEILVGQIDVAAAVQSVRLEPFGSVDLLATGSLPPNPAELLASPRFRALIEDLRPTYDAILLDSPPINVVTDAAIMGRETDGAIVVVRASKTTRSEIAHVVAQLSHVQIPVTGCILNDYDAKRDASYDAPYYGYSYEYRPYTAQSS